MHGSGPGAQRILVCVAWPYAHSGTHVGQIAGSVLPGDIFARYHRMAGHNVLMISGSDEHGTPITVDAERAGISPRDLVARYHPQIVAAFHQLGISWDLYTETDTAHHRQVCQAVFLRLLEQGHLFTDTVESLYCPTDRRFLPDRFVQGSCPYCGDPAARGDQCEACGRTLDPTQLLEPRCRLCGSRQSRVETRLTEHVFLDLPQFEARLLAWLEQARVHWRPSVVNLVLNWIKEGLTPRAVTRDLEWGIPVPLDGFAGKCIYVWLDALIGYFSASLEWATRQGDPSLWERWWHVDRDGEQPARSYYFIGKDNIPFHAIIWPAVLMGVGGLALPFDVPANECMLMGGHKASTSSGNVIGTQDVLDRYGADPVRYYLAATMPETQDSTFSHEDLVRRNNDELVARSGASAGDAGSGGPRASGGHAGGPHHRGDGDRRGASARGTAPRAGPRPQSQQVFAGTGAVGGREIRARRGWHDSVYHTASVERPGDALCAVSALLLAATPSPVGIRGDRGASGLDP